MRISYAKSLCQDLRSRISAEPLGETPPDCAKRKFTSILRIKDRNFSCNSRSGHTRSPQGVALRNPKSQLYQHSMRWTHTISAEGCVWKSEIATLPAIRAMDTHDPRSGLHFEIKNRNFTDQYTQFPQRIVFRNQKTRHARSPQKVYIRNNEPRSYEMLHWSRDSILKLISAYDGFWSSCPQAYMDTR